MVALRSVAWDWTRCWTSARSRSSSARMSAGELDAATPSTNTGSTVHEPDADTLLSGELAVLAAVLLVVVVLSTTTAGSLWAVAVAVAVTGADVVEADAETDETAGGNKDPLDTTAEGGGGDETAICTAGGGTGATMLLLTTAAGATMLKGDANMLTGAAGAGASVLKGDANMLKGDPSMLTGAAGATMLVAAALPLPPSANGFLLSASSSACASSSFTPGIGAAWTAVMPIIDSVVIIIIIVWRWSFIA